MAPFKEKILINAILVPLFTASSSPSGSFIPFLYFYFLEFDLSDSSGNFF